MNVGCRERSKEAFIRMRHIPFLSYICFFVVAKSVVEFCSRPKLRFAGNYGFTLKKNHVRRRRCRRQQK